MKIPWVTHYTPPAPQRTSVMFQKVVPEGLITQEAGLGAELGLAFPAPSIVFSGQVRHTLRS